jgi:glutamate-1-semialdehyde 2,1-aminomutase
MKQSVKDSAAPDPERLLELREREQARFWRERTRSVELHRRGHKSMPRGVPMSWFVSVYQQDPLYISYGEGAHIVDVDGHRYLDTNVGDMSTFCGYAPPAVAEAIAVRARRGVQFMLPVEDSLWVAEEMGRRFGLPRWQFTLSATTANIEAIRLARFATGRGVIVMFEGHYHGHDEEWLFEREKGEIRAEYHGIDRARQSNLRLIPFNDPDALGEALEPGDVACVVTEPVLTNLGVIHPEPSFHDLLRRRTREVGTLLLLDETHTAICGPGGLTVAWSLEPDLVTLGKFIGGGVPIGVYGMSSELSDVFESPDPDDTYQDIASGGTLFANALSMSAARATLSNVMTTEAYAHAAQLGALLAEGIERISRGAGFAWSAHRLYARSGYTYSDRLPCNATEYYEHANEELDLLKRIYFANRGVWEALIGAGPTASVAASREDVDHYLAVLEEFVGELAA